MLRLPRLAVPVLLIGIVLHFLWMPGPVSAVSPAADYSLSIRPDPRGGVMAHAVLHLLASPAMVQAVLTDYEHWPELFAVPMRVGRIERQPGRVVTDLYLTHNLMFGERRLLCENLELPGGGIETRLLGGDFKQYDRIWKVRAGQTPMTTHAEFELHFEVDTLAPDWLVAKVLKNELLTHFRVLKEKTEFPAAPTVRH